MEQNFRFVKLPRITNFHPNWGEFCKFNIKIFFASKRNLKTHFIKTNQTSYLTAILECWRRHSIITLSQNDQNFVPPLHPTNVQNFASAPPTTYKNSWLCDIIVSEAPVVISTYRLNTTKKCSTDLNVLYISPNTNGINY